ncbi:hypothetical protein SAMN05877753_10734 [Bacillus oleivorans]|uniref:DUF7147 domain-containing protein n=1 Tax=Bacillus oleivorans TaxID=1448271 RepID=A0A285D210_9BACI|nr:methylthioribose kinase [Bacillus oleivorans]SNX73348.1 hypothetical protein SAMN05877753_10734 [Bacillus oleivorans]
MNQRFIELGEGYSDIFELREIIERNQDRLEHLLLLKTEINGKSRCSFVVILKPARTGDFQPVYICKEGIPYEENKPSQRILLFQEAAANAHKEIIGLQVKSSKSFADDKLYYQYLIGILRMNRYILPLHW